MIPKAERKRCAWPADLNRLITRSRNRQGRRRGLCTTKWFLYLSNFALLREKRTKKRTKNLDTLESVEYIPTTIADSGEKLHYSPEKI